MRKTAVFIAHFAPHLAFAYFAWTAIRSFQRLWGIGSIEWTDWSSVSPAQGWDLFHVLALAVLLLGVLAVAAGLGFVYYWLRRWHARQTCTWCDRNGRRWARRGRGPGFLAWLFDVRASKTGIIVSLCLLAASLAGGVFNPFVAAPIVNTAVAIGLLTTIAHQARERACGRHGRTLVFKPGTKWGGSQMALAMATSLTRGAEAIGVRCTWCSQEAMVTRGRRTPPQEVVSWMWDHLAVDCKYLGRDRDPAVLVVRIDPDPVVTQPAE